MSILDPEIQVAFSVYENKGVFALLVGSGLSRAAEIPTGWEITLDLVRRIALARGVGEQPDWERWYRETTGHVPNYSTLIQEIGLSADERRSILLSYIEPSEDDIRAGRKIPTRAHLAIAELVRDGYIRVIITTNFDRLIENALRERGVEPTVVASGDALIGAEPPAHSRCFVLKLHGDYKDARILNTDAELSAYPVEYNLLLDRIFDEYGLIVSGWSGTWDRALRAAFLRAANRRYTVFWCSHSTVSDTARELMQHRRAVSITVGSADAFFTTLQQRVATLDATRRRSHKSIDLLVQSTKRLLSAPEPRIELDDLIAEESRRLSDRLDDQDFGVNAPWSAENFVKRVEQYEAAAETLAQIAGIIGRWGSDTDGKRIGDVVKAFALKSTKPQSGLTDWINLHAYPAVLIFSAYGLGLVRASRWEALHSLFHMRISKDSANDAQAVDALFLFAWNGGGDIWKSLPGCQRRLTPLSDHLCETFSTWGRSFLEVTPDYELLFERFEMLGSLASFEANKETDVKATIEKPAGEFIWMPVGRAAWDSQRSSRLLEELGSGEESSELLKAGFGNGRPEYLRLFIANFQRLAGRFRRFG